MSHAVKVKLEITPELSENLLKRKEKANLLEKIQTLESEISKIKSENGSLRAKLRSVIFRLRNQIRDSNANPIHVEKYPQKPFHIATTRCNLSLFSFFLRYQTGSHELYTYAPQRLRKVYRIVLIRFSGINFGVDVGSRESFKPLRSII